MIQRLLSSMAVCGIACTAHAQAFSFQVFENDSGTDTTGLEINLELVDGGSYVDFNITNNSTIGGIATMVLVEQSDVTSLFNGNQISADGVGSNWGMGSTGSTPPGSLAHTSGPWSGTYMNAEAIPSPVIHGIDSGESLTLRFDLGGTSYSDVLSAVASQDLRLVTHIQALGTNDDQSVWGVTVPAPGTLALGGFAAFGLAVRRRR